MRHVADRAPAGFEPLGRRLLSGTGTISLDVYDFSGKPEVNAAVDWSVFDDTATAPAARTRTQADTWI